MDSGWDGQWDRRHAKKNIKFNFFALTMRYVFGNP